MAKTIQIIEKINNELFFRIPEKIVKLENIQENDLLDVIITKLSEK